MRHGFLHVAAADVGVNLRGVELLVTEDVLEDSHVYARVLIHQRGGGVAQLVHRELAVAKSRHFQIFLHHPLYGFDADTVFACA